jgi:CDP-diacylglycerol--glycerol-3-phosphate 3-phosphatidyltransferase
MYRIYSIPLIIVLLLLLRDNIVQKIFTIAIGALAFGTDFFDGYIARKYKVESKFGRCFDPIADKALVISSLFVLSYIHRADVLPSLAIVLREIAVAGVREFLGDEAQKIMPVSRLSKWKTVSQITAIGLIVLGNKNGFIVEFGNVALYIAAIISIVTMWQHLKLVMATIK